MSRYYDAALFLAGVALGKIVTLIDFYLASKGY
jgi:hypothetical protein